MIPILTADDLRILALAKTAKTFGTPFEMIWDKGWWGLYFPSLEQGELFIALCLSRFTKSREQMDRIMRAWTLFDGDRWDKNVSGGLTLSAAALLSSIFPINPTPTTEGGAL